MVSCWLALRLVGWTCCRWIEWKLCSRFYLHPDTAPPARARKHGWTNSPTWTRNNRCSQVCVHCNFASDNDVHVGRHQTPTGTEATSQLARGASITHESFRLAWQPESLKRTGARRPMGGRDGCVVVWLLFSAEMHEWMIIWQQGQGADQTQAVYRMMNWQQNSSLVWRWWMWSRLQGKGGVTDSDDEAGDHLFWNTCHVRFYNHQIRIRKKKKRDTNSDHKL